MSGRRAENEAPREGVALTEAERRSRKLRSIAIGVGLAALALLFYVITIAKLGPKIMVRPW